MTKPVRVGRKERKGSEVSSTPLTYPPGGNAALLPRDLATPGSSSQQLSPKFVDIAYSHSEGHFECLGSPPEVAFHFGKPISAPLRLMNQFHKLLNFLQAWDRSCSYSTCVWQLLFWKPVNIQDKIKGVFSSRTGKLQLNYQKFLLVKCPPTLPLCCPPALTNLPWLQSCWSEYASEPVLSPRTSPGSDAQLRLFLVVKNSWLKDQGVRAF